MDFSLFNPVKLIERLKPIRNFLFIVSLVFPRKDSLWLYGAHGGERFMGNPKYLFLHASNREDEKSHVWICRDEDLIKELRDNGYDAYRTYSLKGMYLNLRASKVFYSHSPWDLNGWCCGGAESINLWHGSALNRVGWGARAKSNTPFFSMIHEMIKERFYCGYDQMALTSEYFENTFNSGHIARSKGEFLNLGYPRNDSIISKVENQEICLDERKLSEIKSIDNKFVLFYLPTWDRKEENPIDYQDLDSWLEDKDSVMVVKEHFNNTNPDDIDELDNVIVLPTDFDIYPVMKYSDCLISDYSSVIIDYLLVDKPIIFFCYDRESFSNYIGFELDYDFFTPGPKAYSFEDLKSSISNVIAEDEYSEEREIIRKKLFDHPSSTSSDSIYEILS